MIASTNPNRVTLVSGTTGVSESKPYIDNYEIDGKELQLLKEINLLREESS